MGQIKTEAESRDNVLFILYSSTYPSTQYTVTLASKILFSFLSYLSAHPFLVSFVASFVSSCLLILGFLSLPSPIPLSQTCTRTNAHTFLLYFQFQLTASSSPTCSFELETSELTKNWDCS